MEERFDSITDQIDFYYTRCVLDGKPLEEGQKSHLMELRSYALEYGSRGLKWAELCDEIIDNDL